MRDVSRSRQAGISGVVVITAGLLFAPSGAGAANAAEEWDPLQIVQSQGLLAEPDTQGAGLPEARATGALDETSIAPVTITPVATAVPVPGSGAAIIKDESNHFGFVTGLSAAGTNASFVVINDSDAPSAYQFTIEKPGEDLILSENSDGSLLIADSAGAFVNVLNAPWARDANGVSLPTSYEVDGNVVTQHVDLAGAAFPVVADPQAGCGIGWCSIYFNRSETHDIATAGFIALGGAAAACAVGGSVAVAACALAAGSIGATATYADNHGQCVGLSFWGVPPVVGWNPFIHDDEYC